MFDEFFKESGKEQSSKEESRHRFEQRLNEASRKHDTRIAKAGKSLLGRLLSPGTILKTAGLGAVDLTSFGTAWSPADVAVFVAGAMDIVASVSQKDRDAEERLRLSVRGALKMGAAAAPFVPSAAAGPVIDAVSEVDRNRPK